MEKNNEQDKGWEDIAIDGLEPIEEANADPKEAESIFADPGPNFDRDAEAAGFYAANISLEKRGGHRTTSESPDAQAEKFEKPDIALFDAIGIIRALYRDKDAEKERLIFDLTELTVALFFEKYPDVSAELTEEQRRELLALFYRAEDYFREQTNNGETDPDKEMIYYFAWQEIAEKHLAKDPEKKADEKKEYFSPEFPKRFRMINDKLSLYWRGELRNDNTPLLNTGKQPLRVIPRTKTKPAVYIMAEFSTPDGEQRDLTLAEKQVAKAIFNLWLQAAENAKNGSDLVFPVYSASQLYQIMGGNTDKRPGKITEKVIEEAADFFSFKCTVDVDSTDQAIRYHIIKPGEQYQTKSMWFPARKDTRIAANHKKIPVWIPLDVPPIFYANQVTPKQRVEIPADLLKIDDESFTFQRAAMRDYIFCRIDVMRKDIHEARGTLRDKLKDWKDNGEPEEQKPTLEACRQQEDTILLSAVCKVGEMDYKNSEERKRVKRYCSKVLQKCKGRLIKDFEIDNNRIKIYHRYVP